MKIDRREFLLGAACSAGAGLVAGCASTGGARNAAVPGEGACPFRLGVAGYTLHRFTLDAALAELGKLGIRWFCAKDFHYPMNASPSTLKELVRRTSDAGVSLYGTGPVTVCTRDEAKRAFDYAAALGVPMIAGDPAAKDPSTGKVVSDRAMCEFVSELADEYRIAFGIHNHGENPATGNPLCYPSVAKTSDYVRGLSPRLGYCFDVAYTVADGYDAPAMLRAHATRIFDVHFRNTAIRTNGSSGAPADAGTIDYLEIVRTLKEIGYRGVCGIELANAYLKPSEINPGADPSWMPRSVGYFRGLMAAV